MKKDNPVISSKLKLPENLKILTIFYHSTPKQKFNDLSQNLKLLILTK